MNHFETPRMIASKVNEDRQLTDLPGNKSMTFEFSMTSVDDNVSPAVDVDRVSAILTTNRINSPVSDFASDSRVNQTGQDPCAATYVSNLIVLENPATSLKVQFAGYRRDSSDIRVMYKILSEGESENSMEKDFDLFPGFDNIDQNGNIINKTNNNGKPDDPVTPSVMKRLKIMNSHLKSYHHLQDSKSKLIWLELIKHNHHSLKILSYRTCIMEEEIELIPVEGKSGFYRDLNQQQLLIVTKAYSII